MEGAALVSYRGYAAALYSGRQGGYSKCSERDDDMEYADLYTNSASQDILTLERGNYRRP